MLVYSNYCALIQLFKQYTSLISCFSHLIAHEETGKREIWNRCSDPVRLGRFGKDVAGYIEVKKSMVREGEDQ
jgi:hypothetical protein